MLAVAVLTEYLEGKHMCGTVAGAVSWMDKALPECELS